jgi:hypothetical protein
MITISASHVVTALSNSFPEVLARFDARNVQEHALAAEMYLQVVAKIKCLPPARPRGDN